MIDISSIQNELEQQTLKNLLFYIDIQIELTSAGHQNQHSTTNVMSSFCQ